jgi:hypothetical protein
MDKDRLDKILADLHAEVERAQDLEDEQRARLRQSAREVQARIERGEKRPDDDSLSEQLKEAVLRFEASHPNLALAITQAITALVDIGV